MDVRPMRPAEAGVGPKRRALQRGTVEAIHVHAGRSEPMIPIPNAILDAGGGIRGDRYAGLGIPGSHITFIAAEGIEAMVRSTGIPLSPAETRRNVLTRGIDVNELVGRRFRVGETLCEGIKPCTPCNHLEETTRPGVRAGLSGQGGLRAGVLEGGTISPGDVIEEIDD
jgi:MOSC domain-containing protein YiiM